MGSPPAPPKECWTTEVADIGKPVQLPCCGIDGDDAEQEAKRAKREKKREREGETKKNCPSSRHCHWSAGSCLTYDLSNARPGLGRISENSDSLAWGGHDIRGEGEKVLLPSCACVLWLIRHKVLRAAFSRSLGEPCRKAVKSLHTDPRGLHSELAE